MQATPEHTILIVDDEPSICWAFEQLLDGEGFRVFSAASAEEGLELAAKENPALTLLDVRLPGISGLEALPRFKQLFPSMPVIVMTAHGTMDTAIEATRRGAHDYLTKPVHNADALHRIKAALTSCRLSREVADLRKELEGGQVSDSMTGKSPQMQEIYKRIGATAAADSSVLIVGESGTGKELVAVAIHKYSDRAKGPFVALNCASLPEPLLESELYGHVKGAFTGAIRNKPGKAELAHGGTLFLDEIGEMPLSLQAKLLRFLEEKKIERVGSTESIEVDVRILAATNQKLQRMIAEGKFREDLFYRLNVVSIELPTLRERKDDIPLLVARFLASSASGPTAEISTETMQLLQKYDWPGNVRELRNAIEHAKLLARGKPIRPEHLPGHIAKALRGENAYGGQSLEDLLRARTNKALDEAEARDEGNVYAVLLADLEKTLLETTMRRVNGNQVKASRWLGIHRTTLRKKLEDYGIS